MNTFGYVEANPLIRVDPNGHNSLVWHGGRTGAQVGAPLGPVGAAVGAVAGGAIAFGIGYFFGDDIFPSDTPNENNDDGERCCTDYRLVYEPNKKHGPSGRWAGKEWISPEPTNGAAILQISTLINEGRRVGYDPSTGELIEFKRHLKDDTNCIEYWHGYVISGQPVKIHPKVKRAAKNAGYPVK